MDISYDAAGDALGIRFREPIVTTQPLSEGVFGEYDAEGRLAGLEIRQVRQRLGDMASLAHVVLKNLGPPVAEGCPPSTIVASHVVLDERGVAWIDDSNIKVIEVVLDVLGPGGSPQAYQAAHPGLLSLAQVHAALAYYYDHQVAFDAEIDRQYREYQAAWEAQQSSPLLQKLRVAGEARMSLALYMDVQVHGGVTVGLRRRGVDVLTAQENGQRRTKDPLLLDRATALGRVLVTYDQDFLVEAAQRQRSGVVFAGVIYEHQLAVDVGQCVNDLELIAKVYDLADMANQVLYLPL